MSSISEFSNSAITVQGTCGRSPHIWQSITIIKLKVMLYKETLLTHKKINNNNNNNIKATVKKINQNPINLLFLN